MFSPFHGLRPMLVLGLIGGTLASVTSRAESQETSTQERPGLLDRASKYIGITYFTFFDGPGIGEPAGFSPGTNGNPIDTGLGVWTNLSFRFKFSERYALDYQARLQQIVTNNFEFRDQGGRLGVSGTLLKGDDWSLVGALNSDVPGLGQVPTQRTLILNPGLFAQFSYRASGSRWSLFSMVSPRLFFYRDSLAMSDQDEVQGMPAGAKPQMVIQVNPSINYALNDSHGLRLGLTVDYRKNSVGPMQRWFWPVDMGYTLKISQRLNLYPHLRFSTPLDDGLRDRLASSRGRDASPWTHTASVGIWINGTLL